MARFAHRTFLDAIVCILDEAGGLIDILVHTSAHAIGTTGRDLGCNNWSSND